MHRAPHETRRLRVELSIPVGCSRAQSIASEHELSELRLLCGVGELFFELHITHGDTCATLRIRCNRLGIETRDLGCYQGEPGGSPFEPLWGRGVIEFVDLRRFEASAKRPHQLRVAFSASVSAHA